jgi:hypothetical protein
MALGCTMALGFIRALEFTMCIGVNVWEVVCKARSTCCSLAPAVCLNQHDMICLSLPSAAAATRAAVMKQISQLSLSLSLQVSVRGPQHSSGCRSARFGHPGCMPAHPCASCPPRQHLLPTTLLQGGQCAVLLSGLQAMWGCQTQSCVRRSVSTTEANGGAKLVSELAEATCAGTADRCYALDTQLAM